MAGRSEAVTMGKSRYVIINDFDAPQPDMVCQWVPGVGYCYLDRRGNKPSFDGMRGAEAVPVETFGWAWAEDEDGGSWVRFYRTEEGSTASYQDGSPRRWQNNASYFEFKRLKTKVSA